MIAEANTDAPKSFCDAPDGTAALRFSVNHKQTKIKTTNNKQIFKPPAWANSERKINNEREKTDSSRGGRRKRGLAVAC
jgi:hypothetical protein